MKTKIVSFSIGKIHGKQTVGLEGCTRWGAKMARRLYVLMDLNYVQLLDMFDKNESIKTK